MPTPPVQSWDRGRLPTSTIEQYTWGCNWFDYILPILDECPHEAAVTNLVATTRAYIAGTATQADINAAREPTRITNGMWSIHGRTYDFSLFLKGAMNMITVPDLWSRSGGGASWGNGRNSAMFLLKAGGISFNSKTIETSTP